MRRDMRGLVEDSRAVAERAEGRKLTDAEVSAFWSERARERIVSDPWGWLGLLGRKLLLFWNGGELGDIVNIELLRDECSIFAVLAVRFALISTLALVGTVLILARSSGRWPLAIFLASSMAAIVLFYFNTRYRMPAVPVLAAAAGYAVSWTAVRISRHRWKGAAAATAAAILINTLVPGRKIFVLNMGATYTFLGNHYISLGRDEKALEAFSEAMRLDPGSVVNVINYARALSRTGNKKGALEHYRRAWEKQPDFPNLALEYGFLLDEAGMRDEARKLYNQAWRSGRRNEMITACKQLSWMALVEEDREGAIMWIERALELAPGDRDLLKILESLKRP
jgi:hypothetical protein